MSMFVAQDQAETTFRAGGNLSDLLVNVKENGITNTTTITVQINTIDSGLSVSIPGSASGIFEDSDIIAITVGDEVNYKTVAGTTGGGIVPYLISTVFDASINTYELFGCTNQAGIVFADATTRYTHLCGDLINNTNEALTQHDFMTAGTLKHGMCFVSQNDTSQASTVRTRKGAVNGNIAISITGNTTGRFENTTSTDAIIDADDVNFQVVVPAVGGAHTITLIHISVGFETTNSKSELFVQSIGSPQPFNSIRVCHIAGTAFTNLAVESVVELTSRVTNAKAKEIQVAVSTNSITTSATTVSLRQNRVDVITISIAAGVSGLFSNTGNITLAITDEINYRMVTPNTSGSIEWEEISLLIDASPPPTKTFTMDIALEAVQTKTFTMDIVLEAVQTKTFTIDMVLEQVQTKTFSMDIVLEAIQTKTFSMDVVLESVATKTFTMDILLKSVQTKTFTMDIFLEEAVPPAPTEEVTFRRPLGPFVRKYKKEILQIRITGHVLHHEPLVHKETKREKLQKILDLLSKI